MSGDQPPLGLLADGAVHVPVSEVAARNESRRLAKGIRKDTDVHIPTRDGSHLLADIYRPLTGQAHPAIARMSIYGRAFGAGSICSDADREAAERREDDWFEDRRAGLSPMVRYAENAVSANASDWVPRGYVLVRVDARGVGRTPGALRPFSRQEAEDYFDAIEWTAAQPWCTGSVGLLGASYAATNQWNVAALKPPALKAMIPFASDVDAYRDLAYPGGLLQDGYRRNWWSFVSGLQCRRPDSDFVAELEEHPFADDTWYGREGPGPLTAPLEEIEVPFLTAVSQTATLHARGGFEAFTRARSANRQLVVVAANYFSFLYRECLDLQVAFFDHFLHGRDAPPGPPVRLMMRRGAGEYEWRDEPTWPLPGTEYREWHLQPEGTLTGQVARQETAISYRAAFDPTEERAGTGIRFLSEPLTEPLVLAGHFRSVLWVSAGAVDMDVFVALRVIDADGEEVRYAVRDRTSREPLTWGCLKVSHRVTDPDRSAVRPWHTHREEDYAPLTPGQVVEIDVELMPATAVIPAGSRLSLHIQPVEGPGGYRNAEGNQVGRAYDRTYHDGAVNRIHVGPEYPSRIILPAVPAVSG